MPKINLVSVEDGLIALGFRKIAGVVNDFYPDSTNSYYVPLNRTSLLQRIVTQQAEDNYEPYIESVAAEIAQADVVAFSSMSDYAQFVRDLIVAIRRINSKAYIVWGGVHSIIVPDDAIKHADAICTGEGEIAFIDFLLLLKHF